MKIKNIFKHCIAGYDERSTRSRRGGMLLIVLIILAVTVILLSSALMITASSRNRYYAAAEKDQANLTAMSVAKAVNQAIYNGDITDTDIADYVSKASTINITGVGIPGLGTATDKSKTTAIFTKRTDGSEEYILVDITTKIDADIGTGGTSEKVRIVLKKTPAKPKGFGSLITLQGKENSPAPDLSNSFIGDNEPVGAVNLLTVKSAVSTGGSGKVFISDAVFTSRATGGGGTLFEGNIVLWGDEAALKFGGDSWPGKGYTIAIGNTAPNKSPTLGWDIAKLPVISGYKSPLQASIFRDGGLGSYDIYGSGFFFRGKGLYIENSMLAFVDDFINKTNFSFPEGIYVGPGGLLSYRNKDTAYSQPIFEADGSLVYKGGKTTTMSPDNKKKIEDEVTELKKPSTVAIMNRDLPTAEADAYAELAAQGLCKSKDEVTAAINNGLLTEITPTMMQTSQTLSGSAYYITVTGPTPVTGRLKFDLTNNDVVIYLVKNGKLQFAKNGCFEFINGESSGHFGRIISHEGANIIIDADGMAGDLTNVTGSPTGLLATDGNLHWIHGAGNSLDATPGYNGPMVFVTKDNENRWGYQNLDANLKVTIAENQKQDYLYSYTVTRDATGKESPVPHLFVYLFGTQSNIQIGTNSLLQGYIGMYTGKGLFVDGPAIIYARFEITDLKISGGQAHIPYCPPPTSGNGGGNGSKSVYTLYGYETM